MLDAIDVDTIAGELAELSPRRILRRGFELFDVDDVAISFSGAEDVLVIEFACDVLAESGRKPRVFSLDTGRLHPETYRFMARVEEHYGLRIEYCFPQADAVEAPLRIQRRSVHSHAQGVAGARLLRLRGQHGADEGRERGMHGRAEGTQRRASVGRRHQVEGHGRQGRQGV